MSAGNGLDQDAFQALLANAFAVQECGLNKESLLALVEIQGILGSERDSGEKMQTIADRVCNLFNASGVAIALLEANELVYHAGAGIATKDVGRHVAVVLNVTSSQKMGREILRVENAETDRRIEADICRQFGAKSLLMLPICENHRLVGVLQVVFDRAHPFVDREIRVYRLIVDTLQEAIFRRSRAEEHLALNLLEPICNAMRKTQQVFNSPEAFAHTTKTADSIAGQRTFESRGSRNVGGHLGAIRSGQSQPPPSVIASKRSHLWRPSTAGIESVLGRTWSKHSLRTAVAMSAAFVLGVMICFSYVHHSATSTRASASLTSFEDQEPTTVKSHLVKQKPDPRRSQGKEASIPGFKRVQIGPNEVDYVAEDVTIRRFTMTPSRPQIQRGIREVNFGEDVTVRYFADAGVAFRAPRLETTNSRQH